MEAWSIKYIYLAIVMVLICVFANINYNKTYKSNDIIIEHELSEGDIFEMQNTIRP